MKPVGVTGFKGEGKGEVVKIIMAAQPERVKGSFALALREEIFNIVSGYEKPYFGSISGNHGEWYKEMYQKQFTRFLEWVESNKRNNPTEEGGWIRLYMQAHGKMRRETKGEGYWVRQLPITENSIIDDLRYDNEARRIKSLGGIVIRVRRPNYVSDGTPSEEGVLSISPDFIIDNDGSIEDLATWIHRYVLSEIC